MSEPWRRGCVRLLATLLSILLVMSALAGISLIIGVRQPGQVWLVSVGRAQFAIGRIVGNTECRRMYARGSMLTCARRYGAILALSPRGADQHAAEYTLFAMPDLQTWR